jgi:lysophospholipase L1-like esterase
MKICCSIRVYKVWKTALATVVALAVLGGGSTASAVALGKIMPLGDSITQGSPVSGGYRDPLYTNLHNAGYQFTFVGSEVYNSSDTLTAAGQSHHEGHGGDTISQIDAGLPGWIGPGKASPDVILLMIGTNDMGSDSSAAAAPGLLKDLIGDIYGYLPHVKLYVSSLTPRTSYQTRVAAFNATIPGIVAQYPSPTYDVHFVDMFPVLNPSTDLSDTVHPNAGGYLKLGTAWFNVVHTPEPSSFVLATIGMISIAAYRLRRARKNWKP